MRRKPAWGAKKLTVRSIQLRVATSDPLAECGVARRRCPGGRGHGTLHGGQELQHLWDRPERDALVREADRPGPAAVRDRPLERVDICLGPGHVSNSSSAKRVQRRSTVRRRGSALSPTIGMALTAAPRGCNALPYASKRRGG